MKTLKHGRLEMQRGWKKDGKRERKRAIACDKKGESNGSKEREGHLKVESRTEERKVSECGGGL